MILLSDALPRQLVRAVADPRRRRRCRRSTRRSRRAAPADGDVPALRARRGRRAPVGGRPARPGLAHRIGGLEKQDGTGNISYDAANHATMTRLRAGEGRGHRACAGRSRSTRDERRRAARARLGLELRRDPRRRAPRRATRAARSRIAHLRHLNPLPAEHRRGAARLPARARAGDEHRPARAACCAPSYLVDVESLHEGRRACRCSRPRSSRDRGATR